MLLLLLTSLTNSKAESDTAKIISEDGYFYVVRPDGKKVTIVKEHEPWAMNKAKLSPDRQYVVYTTANGLAFECEGRDLFYCKTDGTQRTFLHKFPAYVEDWIWLTKDTRSFLIVINRGSMSGPGIWVLDFDKRQLLMSFRGDSVEVIPDTDCYRLVKIRTEREICADELVRILEEETPQPEVFVNWMGDLVYLSIERDPLFGSKEVLEYFALVFNALSSPERTLYQDLRNEVTDGVALFANEATFLAGNMIAFSMEGLQGEFDLQTRRVQFLDLGGDLSLKAFWSPQNRYVAILKTESSVTQNMVILRKTPQESWKSILTKEFSINASISNLEWSKEDETKIYYSLKEGEVLKDSCLIDLTEVGKN